MQLVTVFTIILIGMIASRFIRDPKNYVKVLNDTVFNLFLPALILTLLWKGDVTRLTPHFVLITLLPFFITFLFVILILKALRMDKDAIAIYPLASVFGNLAYLGLPLTSSILGLNALEIAVLVVLIHSLTFFSFGIMWISLITLGYINLKRITCSCVKNPLIISSILGVVLSAFKVPLPLFLSNILDMLGNVALPISLLLVGMWIGNELFHGRSFFNLKELKDALLISFFKLFLLPLIFYLFLFLTRLNLSELEIRTITLQLSMPLAITNFIVAREYECHAGVIAKAVILSTLSLPLVIHILEKFIIP